MQLCASSNASRPQVAPAAKRAVVVRESQRFGELRLQPFWKQICSPEAIGMTIFFTLNVLVLQFYLGQPNAILWSLPFKLCQ